MDSADTNCESPVLDSPPQDENEPELTSDHSYTITPDIEDSSSINNVSPTSAGVEETSDKPAQDSNLLMDLNLDASSHLYAQSNKIEKPTKPPSPTGSNNSAPQYQANKHNEKTTDTTTQQTSKPCYCLDRLTTNNTRCITITGIQGIFTYDNLHHHMKIYGPVIKLRIRYDFQRNQSEVLVVFECECSATKACKNLYTSEFNQIWPFHNVKQWDIRNIAEDPKDFIIKQDPNQDQGKTPKQRPTPVMYHYISLKEGKSNLLRIHTSIQNQIGHIPDNNLRRYSKGLLLKADTPTQAAMIPQIDLKKLSEVIKIEEHKTFNTVKGVIYSSDLMDFNEDEVVAMCPNTVKEIYKVGGKKNTLIVTFNTVMMPDRVKIGPISFKVHNYIERPRQCQKCYSYLHSKKHCQNTIRCYKCSQETGNQQHPENPQECQNNLYCLHCKGNHSPNYKRCPTYQFEENVINKARSEFISPGLARKILLKNNGPLSSYSEAVRTQPPQENAKSIQMQSNQKQNETQDTREKNPTVPDNEPKTPPISKTQNSSTEPKSINNNSISNKRRQSISTYNSSKPKQPEFNTSLPKREPRTKQNIKQINKQPPKVSSTEEKDISQSKPNSIIKDTETKESFHTENKYLALEISEEEKEEENSKNEPIYCYQCNQEYSSQKCLDSHKRLFHTPKKLEPSRTMRHESKPKDHRCYDSKGKINCCLLFQYRNIDTGKIHLVDEQSKIYTSVLLFRKGLWSKEQLSPQDEVEIYGGKRIKCSKCDNLEFKTEMCLNTHLLTWHEDQPFEKDHRPREHKCMWQSPCIELIEERKKDGSTKLCDSLGQQFKNVKEFRGVKDLPNIPSRYFYTKSSNQTSKSEQKKDRIPPTERERKRKQSSNNESNLTPTNKKPSKEPTSSIEMEAVPEIELMSQSLPEQFYTPTLIKSSKTTKEEQTTNSFVNQQTMKFERIGELNNPQNLSKLDGGKNSSMEC